MLLLVTLVRSAHPRHCAAQGNACVLCSRKERLGWGACPPASSLRLSRRSGETLRSWMGNEVPPCRPPPAHPPFRPVAPCPAGQGGIPCADCLVGTYWAVVGNQTVPAAADESFQTTVNTTACKPCPAGQTTLTVRSTNQSACIGARWGAWHARRPAARRSSRTRVLGRLCGRARGCCTGPPMR